MMMQMSNRDFADMLYSVCYDIPEFRLNAVMIGNAASPVLVARILMAIKTYDAAVPPELGLTLYGVETEEAVVAAMKKMFKCVRCGKCCDGPGSTLSLSPEEADSWEEDTQEVHSNFGNYPLSNFMDRIPQAGADLWFHPDTGEELERCPFYRVVRSRGQKRPTCQIHDNPLRPAVCRKFPESSETNGEICDEWLRIAQRIADFNGACGKG